MNAPETMKFERVVITGSLECLSELHVGAGRMDEHQVTRTSRKQQKRTSTHPYNPVCLDIHDRPYLPASSLRGMLSAQLAGRLTETQLETLFGSARKPHDETAGPDQDYGRASALRIYDSRMVEDEASKLIRARTAVDPVTATAKHRQLFAQQLVPVGSRFCCRFELDGVPAADLRQLLFTLNDMENFGDGLGQGKSLGRGRLRWLGQEQQVKVLSRKQLAEWLLEPPGTHLEKYFDLFEEPALDIPPQPERLHIHLSLIPESPILVIDPIHGHKSAQDDKRDLHFTCRNNQACIPASTLKGLLRAHCRRILLTMAADKVEQPLDQQLLAPLFGDPDLGRGALVFEDALADFTDDDIHAQTCNAVDRFTGGVSDSALFDVEAVKPKAFDTALHIDRDLPGWAAGLLILALRDAMEGDLAIGWGRARGFGAVRVELEGHRDWKALVAAQDPSTKKRFQTWVAELAEEIEEID